MPQIPLEDYRPNRKQTPLASNVPYQTLEYNQEARAHRKRIEALRSIRRATEPRLGGYLGRLLRRRDVPVEAPMPSAESEIPLANLMVPQGPAAPIVEGGRRYYDPRRADSDSTGGLTTRTQRGPVTTRGPYGSAMPPHGPRGTGQFGNQPVPSLGRPDVPDAGIPGMEPGMIDDGEAVMARGLGDHVPPSINIESPPPGMTPGPGETPYDWRTRRTPRRSKLYDKNLQNIEALGQGGKLPITDDETREIYNNAVGGARRGRRRYGAENSDLENENRFGEYPAGPAAEGSQVPTEGDTAGPVTTRGLPGLSKRFAHLGGGNDRVYLGDGTPFQMPTGSKPNPDMDPATFGKYNPTQYVDPSGNVTNTLPGGGVPFRTKSGGIGIRGARVPVDESGQPLERQPMTLPDGSPNPDAGKPAYGRQGPLKDRYDRQVARHLAKKMGIRGRQAIQDGESPEDAITRLSGMMQDGEMTRPMAERIERRRRYFGVGGDAPIGRGGTVDAAGGASDWARAPDTVPITPEDQEQVDAQIENIFRRTYDDETTMIREFKNGGWSSVQIMPFYEQAKKNMRGEKPGTEKYQEKLNKLNKWRRIIAALGGQDLPEYEPDSAGGGSNPPTTGGKKVPHWSETTGQGF